MTMCWLQIGAYFITKVMLFQTNVKLLFLSMLKAICTSIENALWKAVICAFLVPSPVIGQ